MKRYIKPAVKLLDIENESSVMLNISDQVADEGQFINGGMFDELEDNLYDDLDFEEVDTKYQNVSNLNVWEK